MFDLVSIQKHISESHLDGWLLYDFRGSNPVLYQLLGLSKKDAPTRRLAFWIPSEGKPTLLLHAIEEGSFPPLPFQKKTYISQKEWIDALKSLVKGTIAMEVVSMGEMPSLSLVDGGTLEAVRSLGVEVISSGALLSASSILDQKGINSLREACLFLNALLDRFWKEVPKRLEKWSELDAANWLEEEMVKAGFMTDWHPHVAVNAHTADPHYASGSTLLKKGDLLLVDLGCKKGEQAIYGDLTRMAVIDRKPTSEEQNLFSILLEAQTRGVALLNENLALNQKVEGWQIDAAVREHITEQGYGKYFIHRTGHNITSSVHGMGTHLDSFETKDTRPLLPYTCCSLEPGIYIKDKLGLRLETDLLIHPTEVEVVGGWQSEFVII